MTLSGKVIAMLVDEIESMKAEMEEMRTRIFKLEATKQDYIPMPLFPPYYPYPYDEPFPKIIYGDPIKWDYRDSSTDNTLNEHDLKDYTIIDKNGNDITVKIDFFNTTNST